MTRKYLSVLLLLFCTMFLLACKSRFNSASTLMNTIIENRDTIINNNFAYHHGYPGSHLYYQELDVDREFFPGKMKRFRKELDAIENGDISNYKNIVKVSLSERSSFPASVLPYDSRRDTDNGDILLTVASGFYSLGEIKCLMIKTKNFGGYITECETLFICDKKNELGYFISTCGEP